MTMALPIVIPSNADTKEVVSPSTNSINSENEENNNNNNNNNAKRKPSRRANTAERRATHNAVERQRRETLNGRFLDLAALLPNLSQIRRPSKSSIVNSSIAHIHASRRHRMLASRELRLVKMEADALRRELNEWRDRSGIPRVEEPTRGEGFLMVLGGELELGIVGGVEEDEEEMDGDEYEGAMPSEVVRPVPAPFVPHPHPQQQPMPAHVQQQHRGGVMVASPTAMSFDNPLYPPEMQQQQHIAHSHQYQPYPTSPTMAYEWGMNMDMMKRQQMERISASPPSSSSGLSSHSSHSMSADQAYLASLRERNNSYGGGSGSGSVSPVSLSPASSHGLPLGPPTVMPQGVMGMGYEQQYGMGAGMGNAVFAMM